MGQRDKDWADKRWEESVRAGRFMQLELDVARAACQVDLTQLQLEGWDEAAVAALNPENLRSEHP